MNWEQVGKISYQIGLAIIEWGFKMCAAVSGCLALAAQGSLGSKLQAGFGGLSSALRRIFEFTGSFKEISWVAREYHQLGRQAFQDTYGLSPVDQLIASMNGVFTFVHRIAQNLIDAPISSLTAAFIVFGLFYLLGRVIKFARQRGQSSWLCRFEQRLGNRVFERSPASGRQQTKSQNKHPGHAIGKSSPKLT